MSDQLVLPTTVAYGDVDRQEMMLLSRMFKRLQDAAIEHANRFGAGTNVVASRAESWVLNRIEARIERYPRVGERFEVTTWSTGVKGFKGYRDFRVCDGDGRRLLTASSLWLYISLKTKSIIRVPREVVEGFPMGTEPAAFPDLEARDFPALAAEVPAQVVTLRYADFDINEHVNNAAYFELVQTALARSGAAPRPRQVRLKYAKAIPLEIAAVEVRVHRDGVGATFSIESGGVVFAAGTAQE